MLGINSGERLDYIMYIRQRRFNTVQHVVGDDDNHSGQSMGLGDCLPVLCTSSTQAQTSCACPASATPEAEPSTFVGAANHEPRHMAIDDSYKHYTLRREKKRDRTR